MEFINKAVRTIISYSSTTKHLFNRIRLGYRGLRKSFYLNDLEVLHATGFKGSGCAIDIGANRGDVINDLLKMCPTVEAFEPLSTAYAELTDRFSGANNIVCHKVGLSSEKRQVKLFVPGYGKYFMEGLSSIHQNKMIEIHEALDREKPFFFYNQNRKTKRQETIDLMPLDHFELKPSIIKIDVEGEEMEVLKGANKTIEQYRPVLYLENNLNLQLNWIYDLNYTSMNVVNNKLVEGIGKKNYFLIPNEQLSNLVLNDISSES